MLARGKVQAGDLAPVLVEGHHAVEPPELLHGSIYGGLSLLRRRGDNGDRHVCAHDGLGLLDGCLTLAACKTEHAEGDKHDDSLFHRGKVEQIGILIFCLLSSVFYYFLPIFFLMIKPLTADRTASETFLFLSSIARSGSLILLKKPRARPGGVLGLNTRAWATEYLFDHSELVAIFRMMSSPRFWDLAKNSTSPSVSRGFSSTAIDIILFDDLTRIPRASFPPARASLIFWAGVISWIC